jgi:hypothetical protein
MLEAELRALGMRLPHIFSPLARSVNAGSKRLHLVVQLAPRGASGLSDCARVLAEVAHGCTQ